MKIAFLFHLNIIVLPCQRNKNNWFQLSSSGLCPISYGNGNARIFSNNRRNADSRVLFVCSPDWNHQSYNHPTSGIALEPGRSPAKEATLWTEMKIKVDQAWCHYSSLPFDLLEDWEDIIGFDICCVGVLLTTDYRTHSQSFNYIYQQHLTY